MQACNLRPKITENANLVQSYTVNGSAILRSIGRRSKFRCLKLQIYGNSYDRQTFTDSRLCRWVRYRRRKSHNGQKDDRFVSRSINAVRQSCTELLQRCLTYDRPAHCVWVGCPVASTTVPVQLMRLTRIIAHGSTAAETLLLSHGIGYSANAIVCPCVSCLCVCSISHNVADRFLLLGFRFCQCLLFITIMCCDVWYMIITLRASCGAVYCNRSCLFVGLWLWLWVCYHDNSKLGASILTILGL